MSEAKRTALNLKIGSGGFEMQTALKFLAVETGAVGGAVFGRLGAVPVAHGDVALFG